MWRLKKLQLQADLLEKKKRCELKETFYPVKGWKYTTRHSTARTSYDFGNAETSVDPNSKQNIFRMHIQLIRLAHFHILFSFTFLQSVCNLKDPNKISVFTPAFQSAVV